MAILRSADGKFYDVDDNVLSGKEVKPENLPKEAQGGGAPPEGGGGGIGGLGGLIQIIVNVPPGGAGGGGAPAPAQGQGQQGQGDDVEGHSYRWYNYWRNCWRNYWRNYYGW